jgi:hypothetical protein
MNDNKHQPCDDSYQGLKSPAWPNVRADRIRRKQKKQEAGKKMKEYHKNSLSCKAC